MTTTYDELGNIISSDGEAGNVLYSSDPDFNQSKYDFKYRVFPEDLGTEDNNHYMVININVPTFPGGAPRSAFTSQVLSSEDSKVNKLRFGYQSNPPNLDGSLSSGSVQSEIGSSLYSLVRSTRRTAESIALHMPNGGLVYTEDNKYEEISMTALGGNLIGSLMGMASKRAGAETDKSKGVNILNAIGSVVSTGGKITGYPLNPRVEVVFATRPQRQWMFEVFMSPRTPNESATVKQIIKTLRFFAAPELDPLTYGFSYIPPAEFDITFFRNGQENLALPRINTCVMDRLEVDYAPQDGTYATFRDGTPVTVRLSMGFRELEVLHKRRVAEGF